MSLTHSDIISQVPTRFEKALSTGDLLFFSSSIENHNELGMDFQIRLCPALQKKPSLPAAQFDIPVDQVADSGLAAQWNRSKAFDPFSPPYNAKLFVGELQDESSDEQYVVLLNKYSVVPHHFLLVSKDFKSQASPLLPPDLVQVYFLLLAGKKAGKYFLAFYNCGENSGASQAHKHIQFIPVDENGPPIDQMARKIPLENPTRPFSINALPYANHVCRLPSHLSTLSPDELEQTLSDTFLFMLDLAVATIRHDPEYPTGKPSYNVLLTLEHMHLIPRKRESYTLTRTGEKLSVNALGFAGMLLVKSEDEMQALKSEEIGMVLKGVGLKSVRDPEGMALQLEAHRST